MQAAEAEKQPPPPVVTVAAEPPSAADGWVKVAARKRWTAEDDKALQEAAGRFLPRDYGQDPEQSWKNIAHALSRTPKACRQRFRELCELDRDW